MAVEVYLFIAKLKGQALIKEKNLIKSNLFIIVSKARLRDQDRSKYHGLCAIKLEPIEINISMIAPSLFSPINDTYTSVY